MPVASGSSRNALAPALAVIVLASMLIAFAAIQMPPSHPAAAQDASSNTDLAELEMQLNEVPQPRFDPKITSYAVRVRQSRYTSGIDSIYISVRASDPDATVTVASGGRTIDGGPCPRAGARLREAGHGRNKGRRGGRPDDQDLHPDHRAAADAYPDGCPDTHTHAFSHRHAGSAPTAGAAPWPENDDPEWQITQEYGRLRAAIPMTLMRSLSLHPEVEEICFSIPTSFAIPI